MNQFWDGVFFMLWIFNPKFGYFYEVFFLWGKRERVGFSYSTTLAVVTFLRMALTEIQPINIRQVVLLDKTSGSV